MESSARTVRNKHRYEYLAHNLGNIACFSRPFMGDVSNEPVDEEEAKKNIYMAIEKMKEKLHSKNDEERVSVAQYLKARRHFVDFLIECKEFTSARNNIQESLEVLDTTTEVEPARANEMRKQLLTSTSNLISCYENKFGLPEIHKALLIQLNTEPFIVDQSTHDVIEHVLYQSNNFLRRLKKGEELESFEGVDLVEVENLILTLLDGTWQFFILFCQYRENPSYQLYLAPEPPVTTPLPTATEGEREKTPEEIENERALRERIDKQREVEAQLPKPKELSAIFTDQYLYERRNLLAAILNELGEHFRVKKERKKASDAYNKAINWLMETTRSKAMFYCFHNAAFNKLEYFQERNDAEAIRTTIAEGKRILELLEADPELVEKCAGLHQLMKKTWANEANPITDTNRE